MVKLQVYVARGCWSCAESRRIVAEVGPQFPMVAMELLDVAVVPLPDIVFATPTYVLNGRVLCLGNPRRELLREKLAQELRKELVSGVRKRPFLLSEQQ